ncbi:MAG: outer membrane lipoprotein carrier protein LolA [Bacteroidales bacterium]|nr:outer membrane lipoprotein carrier protein LolA [Bacteroidales bacterium]
MDRLTKLNIFTLLLAVLAATFTGTAATPTAADILAKAQKEIKSSQALRGSFTLAFDGRSTAGEILLAGNRFRISTPEMTTWFDGKTQWSLSNAADEVSISEPTPDELEQINPFAIIESLRKEFKGRRIAATGGTEKIELTPAAGKSNYSKVVLTLEASTSLPQEIVVTTSDGYVTTITLQHLEKIKSPAVTEFRFDPKLYPLADIIDLR